MKPKLESKPRIDTINEQIESLREEKCRLQRAEFLSKSLPQIVRAVGKTWAYRNNTGDGSGKRWDEFRKLLTYIYSDGGAWLIWEECALRGDGHARLETGAAYTNCWPPQDSWLPCPASEYAKCRKAVLKELANPAKRKAYLAK